MAENNKDISASVPGIIPDGATTTRRIFFTSALALAGAAALAGCGGGGNGDSGGRFNGTYRNFGAGNQATVSVSIDRDGLLTFWVLFSDDSVADYGQAFVDGGGFFVQNFAGFRTFGQVRSGRIEGRTERANDSSNGFDWVADRYTPSAFIRPSSSLVGTFDGFTQQSNDVSFTTFLTVAPDGTSTVFIELDLVSTVGIEDLLFEGVSFDRNGNVPGDEYFLSLFGDQFTLDTSGSSDVLLGVTFGDAIPSIGLAAGATKDLVLNRQSVSAFRSQRSVTRTAKSVNPAALERVFKALKAKKAAH